MSVSDRLWHFKSLYFPTNSACFTRDAFSTDGPASETVEAR